MSSNPTVGPAPDPQEAFQHRATESCDCPACRDMKALARELTQAQADLIVVRALLEDERRKQEKRTMHLAALTSWLGVEMDMDLVDAVSEHIAKARASALKQARTEAEDALTALRAQLEAAESAAREWLSVVQTLQRERDQYLAENTQLDAALTALRAERDHWKTLFEAATLETP